MFQATTATRKILALSKRIRCVQGGTSASKTISILLNIINAAQSDKTPTLTSVVSQTLPHLKKGAIRDFLAIMESHKYFKADRWNKTDFTYTFETGSKIEFFSAESDEKVKGPRRDRLFINEANNIPYGVFDQLEVRTREYIFLDWNPTNEFWFYTEVKPKRTDWELIVLTYRDNEALDKNIVASIEQRKANKNWWQVFGEGQLGITEGRIYTGWLPIEEIPPEAKLERRGLDFGYTNDPTAIVDIYRWNDAFIFDEALYQKGLSNKQIADILNSKEEKVLVVADSAEPKSIDEIASYGVPIIPARKGAGSVNQGIQFVQDQKIFYTTRSANIEREYKNYLWQVDRNGKMLNIPEAGFDHLCFAAGTKIEDQNIEDVGVQTGVEDVFEYEVAGELLRATPSHPILTQRGMATMDALRYDDVVWKKKSLFTQVSGGRVTQKVFVVTCAFISQVTQRILEASTRDCTDLFGKKQTALFLMGSTFIILTRIPLIIHSIILLVLTGVNTCLRIGQRRSENGLKRISRWFAERLLNGRRPEKVRRFVLRWVKLMRGTFLGIKSLGTVIYAGRNISQKNLREDSVITTAVKKRYVGRVPVYNLKTRSGMYLANGIMVSNCDAIRYGLDAYRPAEDPIPAVYDYQPTEY